MKPSGYLVGLASILYICGCSNSDCELYGTDEPVDSSSSTAIATPQNLPGMVKFNANGKFAKLGTAKETAPLHERPSMVVTFDYDFFMGEHEVTCGEMNLDCEDSLPATNISFYDAVLYANAKSKAEGFDTAYTYTEASFGKDSSCLFLKNFSFHPETDAYRLPTEAEWVYVASRDWDPSSGWHNKNSDYTLHKICTAKIDTNGICDMAGNAMEWVNDWYTPFQDTIIANFTGSKYGDDIGERVVKGGSYKNLSTSITLYSRGDVYTITSGSKVEYIGFRLAFGAIPGATTLEKGKGATPTNISISWDATTEAPWFSNARAKLVFRDDVTENLAFIDFTKNNPSVVEISDTIPSFHPDISPDGQKVAFCTGVEGISGKSALYVRNLDKSGSGLVKLDVENAAIPRWRVLPDGDTVIVFVTYTGSNRESAWADASTWQVPFSNGIFGTPSKLFNGAYHGGISEDGKLAVTGSPLLKANQYMQNRTWYNGEQACNVSLSQDSTKKTLFLDFGSSTGEALVGKKYRAHEYALIADSTGTLVHAVPAPQNYTFDHTEWIRNASPFFVATLTNADGAHTKIVLVDVNTGKAYNLVEGEELWHPNVWIKNTFTLDDEGLNLDSLGVYFVPGGKYAMELLRAKMELFWGHLDDIEYFLAGSSRTESGLIPDSITAGYAINMGHPENDMNFTLFLADNYAMTHLNKLKAVVFSLDFDIWQITTDFSGELYSGCPGYLYDAQHNFWKNTKPKQMAEIVRNTYPSADIVQQDVNNRRGYTYYEAGEWGEPLVENDINWITNKPGIVDFQLARLRESLNKAKERDIYTIAIIFPQNPRYKETDSFGRYGPTRESIGAIMDSLAAIQKEFPKFIIMDENKMGDHDYTDEMAENTDHLSVLGANQITHRLDSLLKTLE